MIDIISGGSMIFFFFFWVEKINKKMNLDKR